MHTHVYVVYIFVQKLERGSTLPLLVYSENKGNIPRLTFLLFYLHAQCSSNIHFHEIHRQYVIRLWSSMSFSLIDLWPMGMLRSYGPTRTLTTSNHMCTKAKAKHHCYYYQSSCIFKLNKNKLISKLLSHYYVTSFASKLSGPICFPFVAHV